MFNKYKQINAVMIYFEHACFEYFFYILNENKLKKCFLFQLKYLAIVSDIIMVIRYINFERI